jgi:hypothetical protein
MATAMAGQLQGMIFLFAPNVLTVIYFLLFASGSEMKDGMIFLS